MKRFSRVLAFVAASALCTGEVHAQGIKVSLIGTGTPILNINRFGISTLVEAGNQKILVDAGRGAAIRLHQLGIPLREISAVFVSLMNSDHITGLPDIYATAPLPTDDGRRITPLEVWGPDGVDNLTSGIERMFADNNRMRLLQHETNESATRIIPHIVKEGQVYDRDGVTVSAFLIEHGDTKPDYGYRISYRGHSVSITDDTNYAENLVKNAKGADMVIQSVAIGSRALEQADPEYVNHFYSYLASPEVVTKMFAEIQPKYAVLSHISLYSKGAFPRPTEQELISRVQAGYKGVVVIGQDLMQFEITDSGVRALPYSANQRNEEPK